MKYEGRRMKDEGLRLKAEGKKKKFSIIILHTLSFMLLCFFLSISLLVPTAALCEEQEGETRNVLPLRVEIEGNRRTSILVILRITKLHRKTVNHGELDRTEILTRLLNTRLFSIVEVTVEESADEVVVYIHLKERFTPVPIPVFYTYKEETGGGAFLFDPNLFGRQKILILGAVFSTMGERFQAIYMDNNVLGSQWVLFARGFYGENELRRYSGDDEIYAYFQTFTNAILAVGYKVTDNLVPSVGAIYRRQQTGRVDDYPAPPDDLLSHAFMLNVRYSKTNFRDYYDQGVSAMLLLDQASPLLGSERTFTHILLTCDYSRPVINQLLLRFAGKWGGGAGEQDILTYYRQGGNVGSRGLPNRGIWIPEYGSISLALEEPVYRHKWAIVTTTQFGDLLITGEDDPVRSYPGVGVGIRIYLKELAVPAIGLDGAFSTWTQGFRLSAYIGKSF